MVAQFFMLSHLTTLHIFGLVKFFLISFFFALDILLCVSFFLNVLSHVIMFFIFCCFKKQLQIKSITTNNQNNYFNQEITLFV